MFESFKYNNIKTYGIIVVSFTVQQKTKKNLPE